MSKTTKKYGPALYTIHLRCDWGIGPSPAVLSNWARLDRYAKQDHNKPYGVLTNAQKVQIHYNINSGTYLEQEKKAAMAARQANG